MAFFRSSNGGGGGNNGFVGEIPQAHMSTSNFATIDLGFVPKFVIWTGVTNSRISIDYYDVENNHAYGISETSWDSNIDVWIGSYVKVDGTRFMFKAPNNAWLTRVKVYAF